MDFANFVVWIYFTISHRTQNDGRTTTVAAFLICKFALLGTMTSLKRDAADGVGSALLKKLSLSDDTLKSRLDLIRRLVAKPIDRGPDFLDPQPALVDCVLIGSKNHAADIPNLKRLGVTAVLNCASGGISRLPVDELKDNGIRYACELLLCHVCMFILSAPK